MGYKNKGDKAAYDKEYLQRPEVKERIRAYEKTPERIEKNRERDRNRYPKRKWHLIMSKYGLCKEDFESMLEGQENKCAICEFEFHDESKSTRPHIDHAISSTINLPAWGSDLNNEDKVEQYAKMISKYAPGLRGLTMYPDGSRGGQPITPVPYEEAASKRGVIFEDNTEAQCLTGVCGI